MFKLSFNKPATRLFPEAAKALALEVEAGKIILHAAVDNEISRQEEITRNLRGGFYVVSDDQKVETYLKKTQGKFYGLHSAPDGSVVTSYIGDSHTKYEPCVRVTLEREADDEDLYIGATINFDLGAIRNAFIEMKRPKHRGRPTLEMVEARKIKQQFESQAQNLFPKHAKKLIAIFEG